MYIKAFSKVHEKNAYSASGRHIGHYKAVLKNPKLVQLHCDMMALAWKHGICPNRWKTVIDIMMAKEDGI
jgi:hypothetical protein